MKMQSLAAELQQFLRQHVEDRLTSAARQRVQVELVGPPDEALDLVFAGLTMHGSAWTVPTPAGAVDVHTLLIEAGEIGAPIAGSISQRCNWNYAVAVRNSIDASVTLVKRAAWDARHESLANTSESFGEPAFGSGPAGLGHDPWQFLVNRASARLGLADAAVVESGLTRVIQETLSVGAPLADAPWTVMDRLLSPHAPADIPLLIGLPSAGPADVTVKWMGDSYKLLVSLARYCGDQGLQEAKAQLDAAAADLLQSAALSVDPRASLDELFMHLVDGCGSGAAFRQSPLACFRPLVGSTWHAVLTYEVLAKLLEQVGASAPPPVGRLELRCTNALNSQDLARDEPFVVRETVELRALSDSPPLPAVTFERRLTRGFTALVPTPGLIPGQLQDDVIPPHEKALTYRVQSPQSKPASIRVISLASFGCHGHARISGALRNPPPSGHGNYSQSIRVAGTGQHELVVYGAPGVAGVKLTRPDGLSDQLSWNAASGSATTIIAIDKNEEYHLELHDAADAVVGGWTVAVHVDDPVTAAPRTRFEALVRAHQGAAKGIRPVRPRPVAAVGSPAKDLEREYLHTATSWRGMLAGWRADSRMSLRADWGSAKLGDLVVNTDPRPVLGVATPPPAYLQARDHVVDLLRSAGTANRGIGEIDLSDDRFLQAGTGYLEAFLQWHRTAPEAAAWSDCIAIYGADSNAQAGGEISSSEPVALLLSPLHPLRFGWHCHAQRLLVDTLDHPCPGAGMLDPHAGPALLALPLTRGTRTDWRAFVRGDCSEPHWALLWNEQYLADPLRSSSAARVLRVLGFAAATLNPGFTSGQAHRSMEEVSRILSTRAVMRVGIVGTSGDSAGPVDGVMKWCRDHFQREAGELPRGFPITCDIRDLREKPLYPSSAELALLHEETGEATRWFTGEVPGGQGHGRMDLVLLDQLGGQEPRMRQDQQPAVRAAFARGVMLRTAPRRDYEDASLIEEPVVGVQYAQFPGIAGTLVEAVAFLEEHAARETQLDVLFFHPNQQALATRLGSSSFVAVTSTQVDPACFVRGARGAGGYLWDYELPGGPAGGSRAGYYLVAVPPPSMHAATAAAAEPIGGTGLDPRPLLDEVSRRGIPVLRRLTRGGSQARGELGILLAVRWLQDAFREGHGPVRLPVLQGRCLHLLLPVDSYWSMLKDFNAALRASYNPGVQNTGIHADGDEDTNGSQGTNEVQADEADHDNEGAEAAEEPPHLGRLSDEHPDVLVFSIYVPIQQSDPVQILVTPVEVKFREHQIAERELEAAWRQAHNLGQLLQRLWDNTRARNDLWRACGSAFLAQALDQIFRIYADPAIHATTPDVWASFHGRVLHDVLGESAEVTVRVEGAVIVSDTSPVSYRRSIGNSGHDNVAVISRQDAVELLVGAGHVNPVLENPAVDLAFSLGICGGGDPGNAATAPDEPAPATAGVFTANTERRASNGPGVRRPNLGAEEGGAGQPESQARTGEAPATAAAGPAMHAQPGVPPEVRARARAAFDGFVGNENAVRRITNDLIAAAMATPVHLSKNYLLTGEPSTGKTELARRIAAALDLPFVKLEGRGLLPARLFALINAEMAEKGVQSSDVGRMSGRALLRYPPLVVFVDEVHLAPRAVQESFLTALEPNDRTMDAGEHVARMDMVTFIFATTRASDVDTAFRTRCALVELREYSVEDVAKIVRLRSTNDRWPEAVFLRIAELGRMVPRIALELANELRTEILVTEHPERDVLAHLDQVRQARELDERGLSALDWRYLDVLDQSGTLGEQPLINRLGTVDRDRVVQEIEPLLLRLGFITLGPRGREITASGRHYIRTARRPGA